jgi:hypothetical protein
VLVLERGEEVTALELSIKVRSHLSRGSEILAAIPCSFPSLGGMPRLPDCEASIP